MHREELEAHADHPSGFLALNAGNSFHRPSEGPGLVAYRPAGRYLIQFGGPFAPVADRGRLLDGFVEAARGRRKRIVAVQLQREDAELYAARGFTVNQFGATYGLELARYTLKGTKFMRLRNKISRATRAGLTVTEESAVDTDAALAALDRRWLRSKGWHVKELTFLIGERAGEYAKYRRLFVGRIGDEVIGYISYSPAYGSRPGWLHDLSRRRPDAPPGVMEAINAAAIDRMRADGAGWLHFGFTPFTALDPRHRVDGGSPLVDKAAGLLARHGERIYPARTQLAYKEKWGCELVLPEYVAFQGRPGPGAVWRLLRVTNSV